MCRAPASGGPILSPFSFSAGEPAGDPRTCELCLYYDMDDCADGALIGHRDERGWLFPIGRMDLPGGRGTVPQPDELDSTAAISPITAAQEGLVFWVRTLDGRYALVTLVRVQPGSYQEIMDGGQAAIELEWTW